MVPGANFSLSFASKAPQQNWVAYNHFLKKMIERIGYKCLILTLTLGVCVGRYAHFIDFSSCKHESVC